MNKSIKLLVWASLLFIILSCVGCKNKEESKPILKVITNSEIAPVIFSYDRYYVVYDNGKTKKPLNLNRLNLLIIDLFQPIMIQLNSFLELILIRKKGLI